MSAEYVFMDEWDVKAPIEVIFNTLADARTYPEWWKPVYLKVVTAGPPKVGLVSTQLFKGRLPYHLRTTSEIVRMDPPRELEVQVKGDLSGRGVWTLTPVNESIHIRFDWRVNADRPLLRILTPLLRPLFRWNHNWAIQRAMEGLEAYVQGTAKRS